MSVLHNIRDLFLIAYWSLRGQHKQAVYITMYRKARREGLTHEEATSLAIQYIRGPPGHTHLLVEDYNPRTGERERHGVYIDRDGKDVVTGEQYGNEREKPP
jgi:hypothetical protein